jgi:flagellar basal-body rod modification protein FlgD
MAYVSEIYQGPATQATDQATKTEKKDDNTMGKEQFLTLLVAQLQNQDPLNPSDATEFTAQLAQFSQLEQLFNLNKSMETMAEAQNNSDRISALSMIGKEIQVEGSSFMLKEEGSAEVGYKLDNDASEVTLTVQNSSGQTVATLKPTDLTKGNHFITFNGSDEQGERLPAGEYSLVLKAKSTDEDETIAASPLVRTTVTGVDLGDGGAKMVTDVGEFSINNIHGVYDAKNSANTGNDSESTAEKAIKTATAATESILDAEQNK